MTLTAEQEREKEILKLRKRQLKLLDKDAELAAVEDKYKETHLIEYFEPYPYQQKVFDDFRSGKKIILFKINNKGGKTGCLAVLAISCALGYEPWFTVDENYPGAVKVGQKFYRPSCIGIKPPIKIRISSEDWSATIDAFIIPELKKWGIENYARSSRNNLGIESDWTFFQTKSTIDFMTNNMKREQFEGWPGDLWLPDEPFPRWMYSAMSRGMIPSGGCVLMTQTILKDPWIVDELIDSGRPDVSIITDVCLWDNPEYYNHDKKTLTDNGMTEQEAINWLAKQKAVARTDAPLTEVEQILKDTFQDKYSTVFQNLKIHRFIKDIDVEDPSGKLRLPRLFGETSNLSGRVLTKLDWSKHKVAPFKIPPDWFVLAMVDWHYSLPIFLSFYAFDPYGKEWVIEEVWQNMYAEEVADEIIRRKQTRGWRMWPYVGIDALSKGDEKVAKNREIPFEDRECSFNKIKAKLDPHDLTLTVAPKAPDEGARNINDKLITRNGEIMLRVFDTCPLHITQLPKWRRDDEGNFVDEDDHAPENLYRSTMMGVKWEPLKTAVKTEMPSAAGWT